MRCPRTTSRFPRATSEARGELRTKCRRRVLSLRQLLLSTSRPPKYVASPASQEDDCALSAFFGLEILNVCIAELHQRMNARPMVSGCCCWSSWHGLIFLHRQDWTGNSSRRPKPLYGARFFRRVTGGHQSAVSLVLIADIQSDLRDIKDRLAAVSPKSDFRCSLRLQKPPLPRQDRDHDDYPDSDYDP
jgi:hypothetical protein